MGLKFRRGSTAQQSGSLAFGEPYVNTTLGTLVIGGATGDIVLSAGGTGSTGNFGAISGSGLDITGNANIGGNLTLGGQLTIGDQTSDTVNVVASLSSSLIPQTTNAFDLGSATKIWRDLYISTGSIKFVDGTSVVKELNLATITGLETATGSSASTGSNIFNGNQTITGSVIINKEFGGTALQITGGIDINNGFQYPVTIKDNLVVSGSTILGNSSANSIEVSGSLKTNQKATFTTQYGGVALEVTGGVVLGQQSTNLIEISGSLSTNQKAIFVSQYGTALEITGGVEINNGLSYPVTIKDNLVVSGSSILGTDSTDKIEISGSLLSSHNATFTTQFGGTALTVTGAVDISNSSYPARISNDLVVSGSLYVAQNLVVLGSSSIQNISSSTLNIGTNLITVAVDNPSVRFGGLAVIDSGSFGGSGSFLYDSEDDEFIFVHRGNGFTTTSSVFLLGPETYNNIGGESYIGENRILKGTSNEHTANSNITDDGTTISLGSNTIVTGSLRVSAGITGSLLATNVIVTSNLKANSIVTDSGDVYIGPFADVVLSGDSGYTRVVNNELQVTGSLTVSGDISGSSINGLGNATAFSTSVNSRLDQLSTASGSAITRLTALEVETSNLETFTASLSTTSNVRFGSLGIGMAASGTSGRIDAANDVVAFSTSDIRLKENIKPIENALDKISKISGNTYDWKSELKDVHGYDGSDVGVIAQEIEAVLPQLVQDRDNGYKAVKYDKIVALLIEGIKEQQTQIHSLTLEIEKLKEQKGL